MAIPNQKCTFRKTRTATLFENKRMNKLTPWCASALPAQCCCLLIPFGAHPGREIPHLFPVELSHILHGMPKGWEDDDPALGTYSKTFPKEGKGWGWRELRAGLNSGCCNVHGYRRKAGCEKSKWLLLAWVSIVGLRLALEFRGAWTLDSS